MVAQSVTSLTANTEVVSLIQARSHYATFVEIDHEIISTAILLSSADSRRVVVSYKRKHVLTAQKKVWSGELTVLI